MLKLDMLFRTTLVRKRESATAAREAVDWLNMRGRIEDRITRLIVQLLKGRGPLYLASLLHQYIPVRNLRSADKFHLTPYIPQRRVGKLSFRFAAPKVWNALPLERRKALWPEEHL